MDMLDVWVTVVAVTKYKICMAHVLKGGVNQINLWLDVFHLTQVLYDYYMTVIVQQGKQHIYMYIFI